MCNTRDALMHLVWLLMAAALNRNGDCYVFEWNDQMLVMMAVWSASAIILIQYRMADNYNN